MTRITIIAILLGVAVAHADPVVLAVDGNDVFVDLGARDGVGPGSELELLHEVVARDPRSGVALRDRFALGTLQVTRSGAAISVAHASDELARRVVVGDGVRLVSARRAFVDPWEQQVAESKRPRPPQRAAPVAPAAPPGAGAVDHAALARDTWQGTVGLAPAQRVERWRALLAADPGTPYRGAIEAEIASLEAQQRQRDEAIARARTSAQARAPRIAALVAQLDVPPDERGGTVLVAAIDRATPGQPIALVLLDRSPLARRVAWLYARGAGDPGFTRIELVRDGDAYLRGTIPGALVRGERVDWYVEVAARGSQVAMPVIGSGEQPRSIRVEPVVVEAPIAEGRTHIDAHVDYVDFDGKLGAGYDQYYQAELDFTYRFLRPVYAVRLGFGTLSGTGGPKDVIDADPMDACLDAEGVFRCERKQFSYVYTEVELRVRPNVAVMLRPQAGLVTTDTMDGSDAERCRGANVVGCQFRTGYGARGRVRLGQEGGTNLVLGAAFTNRVGTLLEAAYQWLPHAVVPVQITVQVTDQPVVEDFGVRLIADVGLRRVPWFYPSARLSYQARDIDHSGISGGFALNFDW